MTPKMKKRWLVVVTVWGIVLAMTGLNVHLVSRIQSQRQDLETMQMDLRFLKANTPAIKNVRLLKSQMNHRVKSAGIGFLVVENNLKQLSWDMGLQQLRVETEKNIQASNTLPISISASGSVPALIKWIAAVEKDYPYLVIERLEMVDDHDLQRSRLLMTLSYHFTLAESGRVG
jgi:hypothetical protein